MHAQRQQPDQGRRGHEFGHRLVREAGKLVPERTGHQRDPCRGLAEMAPGEVVHAGRNRQRQRTEQQLDAVHVPPRLAQADHVEQRQHQGHRSRHQPGARAVEVLPVDHPAAERQAVRRLQVLHDLVRMQHEVAGQGHRRAHRKRQRQRRGQEAPRLLGARLPMEQAVQHGAPTARALWRACRILLLRHPCWQLSCHSRHARAEIVK